MNPNEALQITEILVGSAVGFTAIYFGVVILNGLRSWRGISHQDRNNVPSVPQSDMGSSQVDRRDQRSTTLQPQSNRGNSHAEPRHRKKNR